MQAVALTFSSLSLKPMELRNRATGAVITDSQFRAENKQHQLPATANCRDYRQLRLRPRTRGSTSHHNPAVSVQPTRRRG
jgi:hypothetical protein